MQLICRILHNCKKHTGRKHSEPALRPDFSATLRQKALRKRAYAGFWDWPDKNVKEKGVVADFVERCYQTSVGLKIESIMARGDGSDPPDCEIVTADGLRIGVEVTELVDQGAIEKVNDRLRKGNSPYLWAKWDVQKTTSSLRFRVKSKDKPGSVKGGPYAKYILLVHCAEYLMSSELMRAACKEVAGMPTTLIDEAYVILAYDPNTKDYPIFGLNVKKA